MKELVNAYIEWIKKGFSLREISNGWHEVVTPFLNHRNDMIELYLKQDSERITISDGGNTINELRLSGIDIEKSKKRAEELTTILRSFGISRSEDNELIVCTDSKQFPATKHRFIQAVLSVDDMFMLSNSKVENFFTEDVATFFESHDIPFVKDTAFTGRSGFSHKFDFTLPKIKQRKEVAIKAINTPRKDKIGGVLWMLEDTRLVRPETEGLIIINDENKITDDIYRALEEYHISYFSWSEREKSIRQFRTAA